MSRTLVFALVAEHPHLLILDAEVDFSGEEPVLLSLHKCINLADKRALRTNSQHQHMHFGTAGEALASHADSFVVPTAPFPGVPWPNCADFLDAFGFDEDRDEGTGIADETQDHGTQ